MNKVTYDVSKPSCCDRLWQELLAELQDKPWAMRLLGRRGALLYLRFRVAYKRLQSLRPGQLRHLQRKLSLGMAGAALLLALSGGPADGATANTITVDGTTCTLADAITAANTDTATGGCAAGSGADVLNLSNDIDLTSALPEISSEITIEGGGHTIQRTGGGQFRVLKVISSGNLTLNEATISGGARINGSGILNEGNALVRNSTISGNSGLNGGGIRNTGTMTVENCAISNNANTYDGGGISNTGTLMVKNSTVSSNTALGCGGISNSGSVTVQNSTISGNSSDDFGGGGICIGRGTVLVMNSTISDNTSRSHGGPFVREGGGIHNLRGKLTIQNSTLTGNSAEKGGGISSWESATVVLQNSLISGNVADIDGSEIASASVGSVTGTHNLFGHSGETSDEAFTNFTPGSSDINATSDGMNLALASILDTSLAENNTYVSAGVPPGNPVLTHALIKGSAAIDAVPAKDCPDFDQRGFPRNADGDDAASETECDIGAFEYVDQKLSIQAFLPLMLKK